MLSYRSEGKGDTVVLLHAFPLSSAMWEREIAELSRYRHVLAPDLPGFGASPRLTAPSMGGMADQLAELLDHFLIKGQVVVGGCSMGGYVAFEFLRKYPARVNGLMLFSTRADADSKEAREGRFKTIELIEKGGLGPFAEKISKKLVGKTTLETKPEISEKLKRIIIGNKPEGVTDALRAMADRRDSSDMLPTIGFPCLVLAGEEDEVIKPEEGERMHRVIKDSVFGIIPKAGHLINLEGPDTFGKFLHDFEGKPDTKS